MRYDGESEWGIRLIKLKTISRIRSYGTFVQYYIMDDERYTFGKIIGINIYII